MRLLHASEWRMADFISDDVTPPYAILSHTWGLDEVTYHDWRNLSMSDVKLKTGCGKIMACREQAVQDGLEWVWVDTYVPLRALSCRRIKHPYAYSSFLSIDVVSTNQAVLSSLRR